MNMVETRNAGNSTKFLLRQGEEALIKSYYRPYSEGNRISVFSVAVIYINN